MIFCKRFFVILMLFFTVFTVSAGKKPFTLQPWQKKKLKELKYETVVYKTVGKLKLDMFFIPPTVKKYNKAPLMVFVHGGGWGGGNKYKILIPVFYPSLQMLLKDGIACAVIEYRLVKRGATNASAYECVVDCKDAVRFLIKNADKYGIDPDRIGVWGDSAGGHLCLMTALGDNARFTGDPAFKDIKPKFRCVASYYPLTSFMNPELHKGGIFKKTGSYKHLIGGPGTFEEQAKALSPTELLKKDSPPILLLHGDKDNILPAAYSIDFFNRGKEVGADVKLLIVKDAKHGFSGKNIKPSMAQINQYAVDYIVSHLTSKGD